MRESTLYMYFFCYINDCNRKKWISWIEKNLTKQYKYHFMQFLTVSMHILKENKTIFFFHCCKHMLGFGSKLHNSVHLIYILQQAFLYLWILLYHFNEHLFRHWTLSAKKKKNEIII